jgi:hypothetical protein
MSNEPNQQIALHLDQIQIARYVIIDIRRNGHRSRWISSDSDLCRCVANRASPAPQRHDQTGWSRKYASSPAWAGRALIFQFINDVAEVIEHRQICIYYTGDAITPLSPLPAPHLACLIMRRHAFCVDSSTVMKSRPRNTSGPPQANRPTCTVFSTANRYPRVSSRAFWSRWRQFDVQRVQAITFRQPVEFRILRVISCHSMISGSAYNPHTNKSDIFLDGVAIGPEHRVGAAEQHTPAATGWCAADESSSAAGAGDESRDTDE